MAIRLQKGQTIQLEKKQNDLSKVTVGLGWKVNQKKGFFFGSKDDYDLDAIAFLLDANGKVANPGDDRCEGGDVVFFNNKKHSSGSVWSCGDNLVGGDGESDDEQIVCLLDQVPEQYQGILFVVSIYRGIDRKQSFGHVEDAYIRAVDGRGVEMARYELSKESDANDAQSVVFAKLCRQGTTWKLQALGTTMRTDSFVDVLREYL